MLPFSFPLLLLMAVPLQTGVVLQRVLLLQIARQQQLVLALVVRAGCLEWWQ